MIYPVQSSSTERSIHMYTIIRFLLTLIFPSSTSSNSKDSRSCPVLSTIHFRGASQPASIPFHSIHIPYAHPIGVASRPEKDSNSQFAVDAEKKKGQRQIAKRTDGTCVLCAGDVMFQKRRGLYRSDGMIVLCCDDERKR